MLKGIDVNQRIEVSSPDDKTKPKTIFVLKPMSGLEDLKLSEFIVDGRLKISEDYIKYVTSKSVVEIKNPDLQDRESIDAFVQSQEVSVLLFLSTEILNIVKVTESDKKKS